MVFKKTLRNILLSSLLILGTGCAKKDKVISQENIPTYLYKPYHHFSQIVYGSPKDKPMEKIGPCDRFISGIAMGDFDGDKDPDIVYVNEEGEALFYENKEGKQEDLNITEKDVEEAKVYLKGGKLFVETPKRKFILLDERFASNSEENPYY